MLCAQRFPQWMWRNRSVERFVAWLRAHNLALPESERTRRAAGLYGMGEGPIQAIGVYHEADMFGQSL